MIDRRTLMIGNYVQTVVESNSILLPTGIIRQIGAIEHSECVCYTIYEPWASQLPMKEPYKMLSPIPITEEWLLKLGFERMEDER